MATSTVEDYVKAVFSLQRESSADEATVAGLAARLDVTKGSVTAMVKKLRESGLVDAERYAGVRLTDAGRELAVSVLRRHRLVEVFLVKVLGFDWSEVHEEAEQLEHAMSEKLLDRLDKFLGHPSIDPHGAPIPDADGRIAAPAGNPLVECEPNDEVTVSRIIDQKPEFLDFVASNGLRPGARVLVRSVVRAAESMSVQAEDSTEVTLSFAAAEKILVSSPASASRKANTAQDSAPSEAQC